MGYVANADLMLVDGLVYKITKDEQLVSEIKQYMSENIPIDDLDAVYIKYMHKGVIYVLVYDIFKTCHVLQEIDYNSIIIMNNKYGVSC